MQNTKTRSATILGTVAGLLATGVLIWIMASSGLSPGTLPSNHNSTTNGNNTTNSNSTGVYQVELTNSTSLGLGKVRIGNSTHPYILGRVVTVGIPINNGQNMSGNYSIVCRQPDNALEGYIKAPVEAAEWFQILEKQLILSAGTGKAVQVAMHIPVNTPESEFVVYFLTTEGEQYLNAARGRTVSSEDALAAAFKKELASFPGIYEQFDDLYANRGDIYVFRAIYDAFPYYYPELVEAWEKAVAAVFADLAAIPYTSCLATLERLGSVSVARLGDYPSTADLVEQLIASAELRQYVSYADLRERPWEFWITVTGEHTAVFPVELFQIELVCRWLVVMSSVS